MKLSIIIPTKDRPEKIKGLLNILLKNKYFFNEILIIDSSNKKNKGKLKINLKKIDLKIRLFNSKASIAYQRNIGIKKMNKNNNFYMLLDDDISFEKNAFKNMKKFIDKNKMYLAYSFNLIENEKKSIFENIKKSLIVSKLGLYNRKVGFVTKSGWHTKIKNIQKNTEVMWLASCASIFRSRIKVKFDNFFTDYSYLEDLDFSFRLSKFGKLIVVKNCKYYHKNFISRDNFEFGQREIENRFYFIKKNNFSRQYFIFGMLTKILINLLQLKFKRFAGNFFGVFKIIFKYKYL